MIKNNKHKKILITSILSIAMTLLVISPDQSFGSPIGDDVDITIDTNCLTVFPPGVPPCDFLGVPVVIGAEGIFSWLDFTGVTHNYLIDIEANTIDITEQGTPGSFSDTDLTISDIQWIDPAGLPEDGFIADVQCTDLITGLPATVSWTDNSITITIPASNPIPADIHCNYSAEHVDPTIDVDIDIKPGSFPNSINTKSMGVVPVAILGSAEFDVTQVDVTTLAFGPNGAAPSHDLTDPDTYADHLEDVNEDGFLDLVSHYAQKETGITCVDTEATLSGNLLPAFGGTPIEGTDSVNPKGC